MKLISMTDFVLELGETSTFDKDQGDWYSEELEKLDKIRAHANFLKKPLKLEMFVPCYLRNGISIPYTKDTDLSSIELFNEWEEAQEKVIFEGFSIEEHEGKTFSIRCENNIINVMWDLSDGIGWRPSKGLKTIEDLVKYKLQLKQNAIKL